MRWPFCHFASPHHLEIFLAAFVFRKRRWALHYFSASVPPQRMGGRRWFRTVLQGILGDIDQILKCSPPDHHAEMGE
jgi:hypothetical protein